MRKINGKLFLGLLIGTVVLSGTVFAVHSFQYQRIAKALLWQAKRAEDQGQVKRMAQYLQRYLEFNPRDTEEKANLAKVYAGEEFVGSAKARGSSLRLLEDVLRVEDRPDLRRLAVKVALEVGRPKDARDHLARLLPWDLMQERIRADVAARAKGLPPAVAGNAEERKQREDRGALECYWGQVMDAEQRPVEAMSCYRLALRNAPELQHSYARLAYLLRRSKEADPGKRQANHEEANRTMDELVARNKASHLSALTRWRYRRDFDLLALRTAAGKGQLPLEEAAEDVAWALKAKPGSVDVLLAAADLERLRGRSAMEKEGTVPLAQRERELQEHRKLASGYLQRGLDQINKQPGPLAEYARFQLLWHKANLVLDELDRFEGKRDGAPEVSRKEGLIAQVRETIEGMKKTHIPAAGDYLRGRLLVHERRWAEAAALFERARAVLKSQPDLVAQANLYLGQCYEKLEEPKMMFDAYKRVTDWDPSSVTAHLGMASARWAQGQLDEAAIIYKHMMTGQRFPPRVLIDVARLEVQRQMQADRPDWKSVERGLDKAAKHNPTALVELALLRAEAFVRQNELDEAVVVLRRAREAKPKEEAELTAALADLYLGQKAPNQAERDKNLETARTILDEGKKKLGDRVTLRLAEARYAFGGDRAALKERLRELARGAGKFSEEDQSRLLSGLAEAQFQSGEVEEARRLWEKLAALPRQRGDLRLRLLLFDLAIREGNEARMDRALEEIRKVEQSSGAYHRYGVALKLIWQVKNGSLDEKAKKGLLTKARLELDQVLSQRPSWAPVFLARAEIASLTGNTQQAIKDLQEAIKNGDTSLGAARKLITMLTEQDRNDAADVELKRLKKSLRGNAELRRLAVTVALRQKHTVEALKQAHSLVSEETTDPKDLVWMAQVLWQAGRAEEAEKKFAKALDVAGNDPMPWVAMVHFLAEHKKTEQALATIERAKGKLLDEHKALALARCYQSIGKIKEAQGHYQKALSREPKDAGVVRTVAAFYLNTGQMKKAEPLLRQLLAQKDSKPNREWAKRSLALVLASGTDYVRFTEALTLVGLRLDAKGRLGREEAGSSENTENQRAKARVLASQRQKQFRKRAIELLEDLRRRGALTADDQYVLSLMYDQEGNVLKAQQELEALLRNAPKTPQYLAQRAMGLIVQKKLPGDLKRADKLVADLEQLERERKLAPNAFASVELRVRLLEARGKGKKAVELLVKHVERPGAKPDEVLLVLASLGRQKRYPEAYAMCEKLWRDGKVTTEAVGGVSVALLRAMSPTDAQVNRIARLLEQAIEKKPGSVVLLMHLSDLYDKRGNYAEAEKLYRRVLQKEPNNVVALNNLAWLMCHRGEDSEEALRHVTAAVNGLGRRPDLLDTRGLVYLKLGRNEPAIDDLKEATDEAPTPARLLHLARAYHQNRERARASAALREAKAQGLDVAKLHPVEQEAALKLLAEYGMR